MDQLSALKIPFYALTDGATVTVNPAKGHHFTLTGTAARTFSIGNPGYDGQTILIKYANTGGSAITHSLTVGATDQFRFPTNITALQPTPANATDYIVATYNLADTRWDVVGMSRTIPRGTPYQITSLSSTFAASATTYVGYPRAATATALQNKIYIQRAGVITLADLVCYATTTGTAAAWSLSIRLNNTTDYTIASVNAATAERHFLNNALTITVAVGDFIEIKSVTGATTTSPVAIINGYIFVTEY